MKFRYILPVLAIMAGLFVSCDDSMPEVKTIMTVSPASQEIGEDGTATVVFSLKTESGNDVKAEVSIMSAGGVTSPVAVGVTDANGNIPVRFTATDLKLFNGGTITATASVVSIDGVSCTTGCSATAQILPRGVAPEPPKDEPIKVAEELEKNTYAIQKKGGSAQVFSLSEEESRWYVGTSNIDRTKTAIKVDIMDEDPELATMAYGSNEIPTELAGTLTTITQELLDKYPWLGSKFETFRIGDIVSAHAGAGGNVNLDGSSQMWLKEFSSTKGYSGKYQFLFVYVFTNYTLDEATGQQVPGDEYTIYGNAIVDEYVPTLNWFHITAPSDWVKVGSDIDLLAEWTDGAEFDKTKVQLISQTKGHSSQDKDEGYFKWDAENLKLTALKDSGNAKIYLKFAYQGTDMTYTITISTGQGWEYTSFSFSPDKLTLGKYGAQTLNEPTFAPSGIQWDWTAVEIDPETDPDGAFYYDAVSHKLYNSNGKEGRTYKIRMRLKSDHSVSAPLEIQIVKD